MFFLCILLFFSQFTDCKKVDGSLDIQLFRQKTAREIGMNVNNIKEFSTDWLKPFKPNAPSPTNDSTTLLKFLDTEFYAIIQIGKRARPYNLVLDTAWGHSWVMSNDCPYQTIGCWFHNKYDHDHSSTYIENGTEITIKLDSYNISGYFSQDNFHIQQLPVYNQTFIEVTDLPYYYILSKADGVLGLGYSSLANDVTPVVYNLYKQGTIKRALFSVYFNRDRSSDKAGTVFFGRIDKKLANGTITYLPVNQTAGYWQFKMDRTILDDGKMSFAFCLNGCQAIADTSSSVIYGPGLAIRKINRLIRAKYLTFGMYEVNCETINKLPKISFILQNQNFTLHGEDYIQHMAYKGITLCISAFMTPRNQKTVTWVLGAAFLREFYSIYDLEKNQIGFIRAK